ncbi:MAG: type II toxin-antitoxin system Phd/YefM family antitoxin [Tepidisphaeraceae bacterium]|jgi:antitoxin (DNA-binding transcriptional repressor) of toxin-antitoxin stability system
MSAITVQDIERDPEAFVRRLEAGESLVVVWDECPLAKVRLLPVHATRLRPFGLCAERFTVPADFDQSLPDEILKDFEGQ